MPSPNKEKQIRIGILVPSSNTSLEPLTYSLISTLPNTTVHFSRFPVTSIGLDSSALAQFTPEIILPAASLLAHAEVDVIGWSGTAAGWLGFDADEELCRRITEVTGIPATTSVLALNKALELFGVRKMGLVTPYLDDVQAQIIETYRGFGVDAGVERHLRIQRNVDIAELGKEELEPLVGEVIQEGQGLQAVCMFCTNLRSARFVEEWEEKYGVPVFDTVTTVVWDALRMCGVDTGQIKGWGRLMQV